MERIIPAPSQIVKGLQIILLNNDSIEEPVANIVGSYKFFEHKFPSDIDVREVIRECCSVFDASLKIAIKLKEEGMKLRTTIPDTLYSELKTGEYKWTLNEMISGFKYIRDINYQGKYLSLQQAILDSDIVKLDVYVWFAGRYIEMSNFMVIEAITNKGVVPINAQQMPYEKALIEDYHHYRYGVGKEKNVFKSLKRLWSLSVLRKNTKLTNELTPFLDGKWADLYQICADLASVIDITNKYKLDGRIVQHKNVKDRVSQMIELINERLSRLFNQFTFITFSNASFERGAYLNLLNEETDKFLNSVENIDI